MSLPGAAKRAFNLLPRCGSERQIGKAI